MGWLSGPPGRLTRSTPSCSSSPTSWEVPPAMVVKVRDGQVRDTSFYACLGRYHERRTRHPRGSGPVTG